MFQPMPGTAWARVPVWSARNLVFAFAGLATFLPIGVLYPALWAVTFLVVRDRVTRHRAGALALDRTLAWTLALLLLWPLFSVLVNGWQATAGTRVFHLVRVIWCVWLGAVLSGEERRAVVGGFLLGCLSTAFVLWVDRLFALPLVGSVFADVHTATGNATSQKMICLAIGSVILIWLGLERLSRSRRQAALLLLAGVAVMLATLTGSISRNSHVLALVLPLLAVTYRFRRSRKTLALLPMAAVIALGVFLASPNLQERARVGYEEFSAQILSDSVEPSSVGLRLKMYGVAAGVIREHPVLGAGLGAWRGVWEPVAQANPFVKDMRLNNPHNDYLLFAMESGLPSALTLLCLLGLLAVRSWHTRTVLGSIGWIFTMSLAITALFNAPFRDATLGMAMTFIAAFGVRQLGAELQDDDREETGDRLPPRQA
jgi:O-antigen ligase